MASEPDPAWVGLAASVRRALELPAAQPPSPTSKVAWVPVSRLADHGAFAGAVALLAPAFAVAPIGSAVATTAIAATPSSSARQRRRTPSTPDRFMNHL